MTFNPH